MNADKGVTFKSPAAFKAAWRGDEEGYARAVETYRERRQENAEAQAVRRQHFEGKRKGARTAMQLYEEDLCSKVHMPLEETAKLLGMEKEAVMHLATQGCLEGSADEEGKWSFVATDVLRHQADLLIQGLVLEAQAKNNSKLADSIEALATLQYQRGITAGLLRTHGEELTRLKQQVEKKEPEELKQQLQAQVEKARVLEQQIQEAVAQVKQLRQQREVEEDERENILQNYPLAEVQR